MFLGHAACAILIHENRQFMVYTTTNRMSPSSRDPGRPRSKQTRSAAMDKLRAMPWKASPGAQMRRESCKEKGYVIYSYYSCYIVNCHGDVVEM